MSEPDRYPETCVFWPKKLDRDGYGYLRIGKEKAAHRAIYQMFVGPIPDGMNLLHSCDNPACINPRHLRPGTQTENIADRQARNRTARGVLSGMSKLNADQVRAIRSGLSLDEAISTFGIKRTTYYRVRSGEGYQDVSP